MYKLQSILVFTSTIFSLSQALTTFGGCPTFSVQSSFTALSYMGYWYEIGRDKYITTEGGGCVRVKYSNLVGTKFDLKNGFYWYEADSVSWLGGTATCPNGEAKCKLEFEGPFFSVLNSLSTSLNYNVLATDYVNYAVVYTCSNFLGIPNFMKTEQAWIMSRTQSLTASQWSTATTALKNAVGYDSGNLYKGEQNSKCKYVA